jgi:hypothetical protein
MANNKLKVELYRAGKYSMVSVGERKGKMNMKQTKNKRNGKSRPNTQFTYTFTVTKIMLSKNSM